MRTRGERKGGGGEVVTVFWTIRECRMSVYTSRKRGLFLWLARSQTLARYQLRLSIMDMAKVVREKQAFLYRRRGWVVSTTLAFFCDIARFLYRISYDLIKRARRCPRVILLVRVTVIFPEI